MEQQCKFWQSIKTMIKQSWLSTLTACILTVAIILVLNENIKIFIALLLLTILFLIWLLKDLFKNIFRENLSFSERLKKTLIEPIIILIIDGALGFILGFSLFIHYKFLWYIIPVVLVLMCLIRLCSEYLQNNINNTNKNNSIVSASAEIYRRICGDDSPITRIDEDKLDRKEFMGEIVKDICFNVNNHRMYGICGSWGMGKTSLVNCIFSELDKIEHQYEKIQFNCWNYREPKKITHHLLMEIKEALIRKCHSRRQISEILDNMAQKVSGISIYGVEININFLTICKNKQKNDLEEILKNEFNSQLIIFIDDIDRIEVDEAKALFRAIRLFVGLPKLIFILAYDKNILMKQIYRNFSNSEELARDYFAKLVQQEFNLSIPSINIREKLFNEIVIDIKGLSSNERDKLLTFIKESDLSDIIYELLPTPREIKRVLAATLWIYFIGSPVIRYNLIDLFLTTLIQYRLPELFFQLDVFKEEIKKVLNIYLLIKTEEIKNEKDALLEKLIGEKEGNQTKLSANKLLKYLLYLIFNEDNNGNYNADLSNALTEKRFCHPELLETYFQYAQSNALIELDKFTMAIQKFDEDDDIEKINKFIADHINQLLKQQYWDIFTSKFFENVGPSFDQIKQILLSLSEETCKFIEKKQYDLKNITVYYAYSLLEKIDKKPEDFLLNLLNEILGQSKCYYFMAYLIKAITDPGFLGYREHIIRSLSDNEKSTLKDKLIHNYIRLYPLTEKEILSLPNSILTALLFWTDAISPEIKEKIRKELEAKPHKIFNILNLFTDINKTKDDSEVVVFSNNLDKLNKIILCKWLFNLIQSKNLKDSDVVKKKQIELLKEEAKKTS